MKTILSIGLVLWGHILIGQGPEGRSLRDLVAGAFEGNYEVALANYEAELSELKGEDPTSALLPKINFSSSYFNYLLDVPQFIFSGDEGSVISGRQAPGNYPVGLGLKHNLVADLSLEQRVFDVRFFGRDLGRTELTNLTESRVDQKKAEVAAEVAEAYYRLQWSETNSAVISFNIEKLQQLLNIIRAQIANQMATPFDSARVSKELAGLRLQSHKLASGKALQVRRLRQLSKVNFADGPSLTTPLEGSLLSMSPEPEMSLSPQARTLSYALSINELQQKATRLSGVPTIDVFGHLYWQSQSPSINVFGDGFWNNMSTLGLQLSVPIYNGEKLNRESQQLELEASMLELRQQQLTEGQNLQLQKLEDDLAYISSSLRLEQEWLGQLRAELVLQEKRFQQDLIGINDLLGTQTEVMESEQKINTYFLDLRLLEIQVLQLRGQLIESIMTHEE